MLVTLSRKMGFQHFDLHNAVLVILFISPMSLNCKVSCARVTVSATKQALRGYETDRLALLAIKDQITDDPFRIMDSWNESLHFCLWRGVACGPRHQRVTKLDLSSHKLRGLISPSIANLSFIRTINLSNNSLGGEIPRDINRLYRLRVLVLANNSLVGQIPANLSLCSDMRVICLDNNYLTGKIPTDLGFLSKLTDLRVGKNSLTGNIPPHIGNMSSLQILNFQENRLYGQVPDSLGQLKALFELHVSGNRLSGTFPKSIYNLSQLAILFLPDNQLEGTLPRDIGLTLPRLKWLVVWGNRFSGPIPVSLANASNLFSLELSNNSFSGGVPNLFWNLKNLEEVAMDLTQLGSGESNDLDFFASLTNCSNMKYISLVGSNFGGTISNSISNLTQLKTLTIAENVISGNIPDGIGNLISLTVLEVDSNLLSGTIPATISKLSKLEVLNLKNNRFSGKISSFLGNSTSLLELTLQGNNFQGNIPSSLENCNNLYLLDLSSNALNGTIPQGLLGLSSLTLVLNLSRNHLIGSLPLEVGNLKKLDLFDISHNRLSGDFPQSLGDCTMLRKLFMDHNMFDGTILESLSLMRGLEVLDLSHNNLSGQIPKGIARLAFLSKLDLSFNDLEGELPKGGVFSNARKFSILGNPKLCGGLPQLHLQVCSKKKWKRQDSFHVGKLTTLILLGSLAISLVLYLVFSWWFKKEQNQQTDTLVANPFTAVSYGELHRATNGFSAENLIGEGSIGSVYKGILEADQTAVAVKVFNLEKRGASKSFVSECETLRGVRHRNLVKIITACSSIDYRGNEFKALVYELMPNGNLELLLHPNRQTENQSPLTLSKRIEIAIDVASAVDYLHNNVDTPIIHCDLKPSNILLDQENNAHLGDFGLSRIIEHDNAEEITNNQASSSGLKGTIGYAAPEYGMGSKVSKEGDVYSFGILLLEMFTGKRPTDSDFRNGMTLNQFVKMALPESVMEIVDKGIIPREDDGEASSNNVHGQGMNMKIFECCVSVLRIGVICSDEFPRARMKIQEALKELFVAKKMFLALEVKSP